MSDKLEVRVRQLETDKQYMSTNAFMDMELEEQVSFIQGIKELGNDIEELKKEIDSLEEAHLELQFNHRILQEKYGRVIQDGDLWLGDVLDLEKPHFGSNNLIISPVGSGKSYTIFNKLAMYGS